MAGMARAALIALLSLLLAAAERRGEHAGAGLYLRASNGGAIELSNSGASPITIGSRLGIEERQNGRWVDTSIWLPAIATCFDTLGNLKSTKDYAATVTLQPRQRLSVVRWLGYSCRKQCPSSCGFNLYLGAGPFRYVATILPGGRKVRSSSFTMPRRPTS